MISSGFEKGMRDPEARRLDAIRVVDSIAVAVAAERSGQAANVLAAQVATSAETQRTLVAQTATNSSMRFVCRSNRVSPENEIPKAGYLGGFLRLVIDTRTGYRLPRSLSVLARFGFSCRVFWAAASVCFKPFSSGRGSR